MRQAYFCDLLSKGGLTEEVSVRRVGQRTMELNQVSYFINLAETLNFTAAARLSGVSQPSLTRAIRRLRQQIAIQGIIAVLKKCLLTPIAALGDMIGQTGDHEAREASHAV